MDGDNEAQRSEAGRQRGSSTYSGIWIYQNYQSLVKVKVNCLTLSRHNKDTAISRFTVSLHIATRLPARLHKGEYFDLVLRAIGKLHNSMYEMLTYVYSYSWGTHTHTSNPNLDCKVLVLMETRSAFKVSESGQIQGVV